MSGRVEVNRKLGPVVISGRVLNEIYSHARESYPDECCGLVTGLAAGRLEEAHRCENVVNSHHGSDPVTYPRGSRFAFHMNERDYVRVSRKAEATGATVTGIYHSHVETGAYFSIEDQQSVLHEMYPFPEVDHIVVSVMERVVKEAALFRRFRGAARFEGRRLVAEAP